MPTDGAILGAPQAMEKKQIDYIFEPNKAYIVADLIPRSLKTQLFKVRIPPEFLMSSFLKYYPERALP